MTNSSYIMLKEEEDQSIAMDRRCKEGKIIQATNQSLSQLNVALGLVVCLTVLTGGVFIMAGLNDDVTRAGMDQKRNWTLITQDTRLVPPSTHNMSHHHSGGFHANMSHILSHHNSSLSQKSPVSDTVRVKRYLYYPMLPAYNPYYSRPTTTTSTIAPWIQSYNDTHHFKVNYTHKQIAETPLEKANVTTLGFSKDTNRAAILFLWHKEKHNKCEIIKRC